METIEVSEQDVAKVFDEWARQHEEHPTDFQDVLAMPNDSYGKNCASFFFKLHEVTSRKIPPEAPAAPPAAPVE